MENVEFIDRWSDNFKALKADGGRSEEDAKSMWRATNIESKVTDAIQLKKNSEAREQIAFSFFFVQSMPRLIRYRVCPLHSLYGTTKHFLYR